jgi:hypothetical protein
MDWPVALVVAVAALVVLVLTALWLWWTANRLDRMHHRIEVSRASLDSQLLHRSGTALEVAASGALDPARSLLLADSAHRARAATADELAGAESDLSQALRAVFPDPEEVRALRGDPGLADLLDELDADCRKVELARRFHNQSVVAARDLRSRRRVRWLRLAGHAAELQTVDLDDQAPAALEQT